MRVIVRLRHVIMLTANLQLWPSMNIFLVIVMQMFSFTKGKDATK